ncbi:MAG: family 4 glycosyl hydrolase [Planctomycetota bacterium]|jgi:alpha-galactosidase
MHENVTLIGAGSAVFSRGLVADIIRQGWSGELRLVDIDPSALSVTEERSRKMVEAGKADIKVSAATDRTAALKGATVVICTIGVGGRRSWEHDVLIPRKYSIYQPVGDTIMPGGASRALRMIPAMIDIARDIEKYCPDALFFNYGNPMSAVCRGVSKATGIPMIGLCHGVFHVAGYLADLLEVKESEFEYSAAGMNHLTWFTEIKSNGKDLLPELLNIADEKLKEDLSEIEEPFTWQLTSRFKAFPAVLDRHVTEFFPHLFRGQGSYYGKTLGIDAFSFEKVIERGDKFFNEEAKAAKSDKPLPEDYLDSLSGEHEQVTEIVESIRNNSGKVFSANLPNNGQVPGLPLESVVESPAKASSSGLTPLNLSPLSPELSKPVASALEWIEVVVEAALEGSRDKFIEALILDASVNSVSDAEKMAAELLKAQAEYLPQFK